MLNKDVVRQSFKAVAHVVENSQVSGRMCT
jgi:hypothetical protein